MSSRELISDLLENLVEPSVCKSDPWWPLGLEQPWPESVRIAAETHKEVALLRAARYVGGPNAYDAKVFLAPDERVERFIQAAHDAAEESDVPSLWK